MDLSLGGERLRAWNGRRYTFGQDMYKKAMKAGICPPPTPLLEAQRLQAAAAAGALDLHARSKEPLDQTKARDVNEKHMPTQSEIDNTKKAQELLVAKDNLQKEEVPKESVAQLQKTAAQVRHNLKMNNVRLIDLMDEIKDFYESQARESTRAEAFGGTAPLSNPADSAGIV